MIIAHLALCLEPFLEPPRKLTSTHSWNVWPVKNCTQPGSTHAKAVLLHKGEHYSCSTAGMAGTPTLKKRSLASQMGKKMPMAVAAVRKVKPRTT